MKDDLPTTAATDGETPTESPEERTRRVAEIKRRVVAGKYRVDVREILYNMLKTAP